MIHERNSYGTEYGTGDLVYVDTAGGVPGVIQYKDGPGRYMVKYVVRGIGEFERLLTERELSPRYTPY